MREERKVLLLMYALAIYTQEIDEEGSEEKSTYVWFSPLGDRNHAATHMAATTARPMKMLYLRVTVSFEIAGRMLPMNNIRVRTPSPLL